MGRAPCCDEIGVKKGPWTAEEDKQLVDYVEKHGEGSWRQLPKLAGLNRCGKSCRLRWTNYLRPNIKRGNFSEEEERVIIHLHSVIGNKWSQMASRLPGRTDNEIKNYWNTHLRKKLLRMGIDPVTHRPRADINLLAGLPNLLAAAANFGNLASCSWDQNALRLQADSANLARLQILGNLLQVINSASTPPPYIGDYQFNGLQLQNQFEGLQDPVSRPSDNFGFLSSDSQTVHTSLQASTNSSFSLNGVCSAGNGMEGRGGNSYSFINTPANSTPSLISTSPENSTIHQTEEPSSSSDFYAQSQSLKPFDGWEDLFLDDLDKDHSWNNILEHVSWPDEL